MQPATISHNCNNMSPEYILPNGEDDVISQLPSSEELWQRFDKGHLLGKYEISDSMYVAWAGILGGKQFGSKQLAIFFVCALDLEQQHTDTDPDASDFVLSHFDEFADATLPDKNASLEAKRFMRKLQQTSVGQKFSLPIVYN